MPSGESDDTLPLGIDDTDLTSAAADTNHFEVSRTRWGDEEPASKRNSRTPPKIDGFQLEELLGQGGMGTVWRAYHDATSRYVAIKLLLAGLIGSDRHKRRFDREVEVTASLQHPNIARLLDANVDATPSYFVMELIDGISIDHYVRRHRLSSKATLELMVRVCEAVQYAHEKGVIHRDLKPSNILVSQDGEPHVLDFGLAKVVDENTEWATITREGDAAGTPIFMAPEQANGHVHELDTRTDVYLLGATIFTLLTGESPHDSTGTQLDLLNRVATQEVRRPRKVNAKIDSELEAILLKALSRDPKNRYGTAGELLKDIERYLNGQPLMARAPTLTYFMRKRISQHKWKFAFSTLLVFALLSFSLLAYRNVVIARDDAKRHLADSQLSEGDAMAVSGRWKEAKHLYRTSREILEELEESTLRQDIAEWNAFRKSPPPLVSFQLAGGRASSVIPHADGKHAFFAVGPKIQLVDLRSGTVASKHEALASPIVKMVGDHESKTLGTVHQDGRASIWRVGDHTTTELESSWIGTFGGLRFLLERRQVIAIGKTGIGIFGIDDGKLQQQIPVNWSVDASVDDFDVLSDGKRILTCVHGKLSIWDLDSLKDIKTIRDGQAAPFWVKTSHQSDFGIVGIGGRIELFDLDSGTIRHAFPDHTQSLSSLDISPKDNMLLSASIDGGLKVWSVAGELIHTYSEHNDPVVDAAFLPDSRLIVSVDSTSHVMIWTVGEIDQSFSFQPAHQRTSRFSADGRLISIVQDEDWFPQLRDVATGHVLQEFDIPSRSIETIDISPDYQKVMMGHSNGDVSVWSSQDAKCQRTLKEHARVICVRFSADGSIAATSGTEGKVCIWDTSNWQLVRVFQVPDDECRCIAIDIKSASIAIGCEGGGVMIWNVNDGQLLRKYDAGLQPIQAITFIREDGDILLTTGNNIVHLNKSESSQVHILQGHGAKVTAVNCSPDGLYAITGDAMNQVCLWDLQSQSLVRTIQHSGEGIQDLRIKMPKLLLLVSSHQKVSKWDIGLPRRIRNSPEQMRTVNGLHAAGREAGSMPSSQFSRRGVWTWAADRIHEHKPPPSIELAQVQWRAGRLEEALASFNSLTPSQPQDARYVEISARSIKSQLVNDQ